MNGGEDLAQWVNDLLGIELRPAQREAFDWFRRELIEWNRRYNLTAIRDPGAIDAKHFLDSLSNLLVSGLRPPARLIDVGTGAGFPGIPLKIAFPEFHLTLVESIGKKADFCRHVVATLGLSDVEVLHARAESVGRDPAYRERFDWALARAVAAMPTLAEYLLPLVRVCGAAVMQKGDTAPAEVQAAESALRILGGEVEQILPVELPRVVERRFLVVVRKCAATPERYPRRVGVPAKRPLA